ncbi:hypothetical protein FHX42_001925 [Saccharopolyspora lacisalsi]|uniref:Cas12f1-like TNB domain-containing protein n=1 Tax=Halosaccharopolyspora lacisalsi TaxID=1000566 RepID=A0A839E0S3_9PSEU|nr:zinc ribbon domain-containing protein [Halosaccharopolyspora lacisalsi]MBA8824578.1 hypothetical protein [Halosaccharopolyspora lacisalsi]
MKAAKTTRIAYSDGLNPGKQAALTEQARRPGRVRAKVWREYGALAGVGVTDRDIRDRWLADGTADQFGVLANAWKETLRDTIADIATYREAATAPVRRAIARLAVSEAERKRLYTALRRDTWPQDGYLSRMMRQHWRHGHSRVANRIIVRADQYTTWAHPASGNVWLSVPGLERRSPVRIPLNTNVAPSGTLRLILRDGRVEVHHQIDAATMPTSQRPCGTGDVGVDKGYAEALVDSHGNHHGDGLGELLASESDHRKCKGQSRSKLRALAQHELAQGNRAKHDRIVANNLGTVKWQRRAHRLEQRVRTLCFTAAHQVCDHANHVVAEDLAKPFSARHSRGRTTNRRLNQWTKGVLAEALSSASERRSSALSPVNAAYTSQVAPCCGCLGDRAGDRLHCTRCGDVWRADHAAAITILRRHGDPDISLHTPHKRVRQILQDRDRRSEETAPPGLRPPDGWRAKHP